MADRIEDYLRLADDAAERGVSGLEAIELGESFATGLLGLERTERKHDPASSTYPSYLEDNLMYRVNNSDPRRGKVYDRILVGLRRGLTNGDAPGGG